MLRFIKVYYSNSTNDVSWQFPLSQKESNTFNSLYHPRCAQGYLEFLPPNPSQCANANDIYLHVQKLHDVQICEQKFSNYLRIHYYSTKAIIVLVFEKYTDFNLNFASDGNANLQAVAIVFYLVVN